VHRLTRAGLHLAIVAVTAAFSVSFVQRSGIEVRASFVVSFLVFVTTTSVAAYIAGLPHAAGRLRAVMASIGAPLAGGFAVAVGQLASIDRLMPRSAVLGSIAVLCPTFLAIWAIDRRLTAVAHDRLRVVLVAEPAEIDEVRQGLMRPALRLARIVASITPADALAPMAGRPLVDLTEPRRAEGSVDEAGRRTLATVATLRVTQPLVGLTRDVAGTVLVLSRSALSDPAIVSQASRLHQDGVRVRSLADFSEQHLGKVPLSELAEAWLLFDIGEIHSGSYPRTKRLIDVVGATVMLPLALLVVPFVLVGNLLGNRGPLLYRQPRVGKGGEVFEILKFRSMVPTTAVGGSWTQTNDPRITRFGKVLRTTHLDELPQLVNILRGDLSFVGPRPEQPLYVAQLETEIPHYGMRHLVRPGLTGWAQVCHPYGASVDDSVQKLQYDVVYLRRQSLSLDVRILGRTLQQLLEGRGR
jgi:lipopolysaccharide/colanic/teichoic acid biosynthesis glycosyltransferase